MYYNERDPLLEIIKTRFLYYIIIIVQPTYVCDDDDPYFRIIIIVKYKHKSARTVII